MKISLIPIFFLAALGSTALAAPKEVSGSNYFTAVKDLGNVMYVGDGTTQGVTTPSYRWPLFKIFVDNGILHKEVGVNSGNYISKKGQGCVLRGNTMYGKERFLNVHSAIYSMRAYEISGRSNNSERFDGSNIFDWLGLDETYYGYQRIDSATQTPASYFLMIGMADTLLDAGKAGIGSCIEEKQEALLGKGKDMDVIIKAMREASPNARIAVMTIPTWGADFANNHRPADYAAIRQYNAKLKEWGKARKVAVIDVNQGLIDVSTGAFVGVDDLFLADKLNLGEQAELIIAGNIAQQLGYAGRTAGLKRWSANEFPLHMDELAKNAAESKISKKGVLNLKGALHYNADSEETKASTVELSFTKNGYGNGAKGGWSKTSSLIVELSAANRMGRLSINECSIRWGDGWGRTLYSGDMSKIGNKPIRIVYTAGCPSQGVADGFYVWLGDMLIGEGLRGRESQHTGLEINSGSGVNLVRLDYDPENAWAPVSRLFSNTNPLIPDGAAGLQRNKESLNEATPDETKEKVQGGYNLCQNSSAGDVNISLGEQAASPTSQNDPTAPNALCTGEHKGSVHLTITPNYTLKCPWNPFFASIKGKGIEGNATLEVNSAAFRVKGGTYWGTNCSVVGTLWSTVTGAVEFILRKGTYEGNIYGGAVAWSSGTSIGSTRIELEDACVIGNVYAGGVSGIIKGDTAIVLDGAARVEGEQICAGAHMGIRNLDGGKIMGNSSVTLRNAAPGSPMAAYRGTLSGGMNVAGRRSLVFDNVTAGALHAKLADFDEIHIINGSIIKLNSLGEATELFIDSTSRLTLTEGHFRASVCNNGSIELVRGCTLDLFSPNSSGSGNGRYMLKKGASLQTNKQKIDNKVLREK